MVSKVFFFSHKIVETKIVSNNKKCCSVDDIRIMEGGRLMNNYDDSSRCFNWTLKIFLISPIGSPIEEINYLFATPEGELVHTNS